MEKYTLRKWNDPMLTMKCQPVEDFSNLDDVISSMKKIMSSNGAIGIAAPQIGYDGQIILAAIDDRSKVFINPKIVGTREIAHSREGCISFPGMSRFIERNYSIDLTYHNELGHETQETYRGINAIVIQHEIDHLNGKNIIEF